MKNKEELLHDDCCGDDHSCCGESCGDCCGDDCCDDDEYSHCCGHDKKKDCKKIALVALAIIAIAGIVIVSLLRDRIINRQYRSVNVTGQGRVAYNPDIAVLTLGVQVDKAESAEEALNQLNSKMEKIVEAVKSIGINDSDIQTQNYSLYPQYDYQDNISKVSGYNANQQLVIKVTGYDSAPDRLSDVISASSKAGANQVSNLSFDASNMNDLKEEAKLKAIEDAKVRGQVLAEAAGVKLKEVMSWYENYINPTPYYMDYGAKGGLGAAAEYSATLPAGSREVIIEMNVSYRIK